MEFTSITIYVLMVALCCVFILVRRGGHYHCTNDADCAGWDCTNNPKGHVQFCNFDPSAHTHAAMLGVCDCKHDAGHHHH